MLILDTDVERCKLLEFDSADTKQELHVASDGSVLCDFRLVDFDIAETSLDDTELDACKLEEFAEQLLTDISGDLDDSIATGNESIIEEDSKTDSLLESVVGSTTKCLESGQSNHNAITNSSLILNNDCSAQYNTNTDTISVCSIDANDPFTEIVDEIYCESKNDSNDLPTTPGLEWNSRLLSAQTEIDLEDKCNRMKGSLLPNVYLNSNVSDCGYESGAGSPHSTLSSQVAFDLSNFNDADILTEIHENGNSEYYWPSNSLGELFPDLI